MKVVPDYSLFPNKEEWGTGDEAMDNKLSLALKKVKDELTIINIKEFYFYGLSLKPRAYNPAFHSTIELVTKAFLFSYEKDSFNDQQMLKIKGDYSSKNKIKFELPDSLNILQDLKTKKSFRYKGQIDFYLQPQTIEERNPFVRDYLLRAPYELHTKIIFKEFKSWLSYEFDSKNYDDFFFRALQKENQLLSIDNFGEIWYHQGQIYSYPLFEL